MNSGVLAAPRLAFLGDVFAIPAGWPLANVFSIGDVLARGVLADTGLGLLGGLVIYAAAAVVRHQPSAADQQIVAGGKLAHALDYRGVVGDVGLVLFFEADREFFVDAGDEQSPATEARGI